LLKNQLNACLQLVHFGSNPYLCHPKLISDEKDVSAFKEKKEK